MAGRAFRGEALEAEIRRWRALERTRPERVETPGPGQESVWDYPRPPRVEPVAQAVQVDLAGERLAQSVRALRVVETASPPVYYVPPEDVRTELLTPDGHSSLCEWKGLARYWNARIGRELRARVAWSYPDPLPGFEAIREHLAFYAGRVDACRVGPQRATPQAGDFYGGWVTPGVVGPFKGEPGSEGW